MKMFGLFIGTCFATSFITGSLSGFTVSPINKTEDNTEVSRDAGRVAGASVGGVIVFGLLVVAGVWFFKRRFSNSWTSAFSTLITFWRHRKQEEFTLEITKKEEYTSEVTEKGIVNSLCTSRSPPLALISDRKDVLMAFTQGAYIFDRPEESSKPMECNLTGHSDKVIRNTSSESSEDNIYEIPGQPQSSSAVREHGEPDELYEKLAQENLESNYLQLNTLDEPLKCPARNKAINRDKKQFEVADENPAVDTYYNTARLKRTRVRTSKLLQYIKGKTDYEEEFERLPKGLTKTCDEALKPCNRAKNRYNGIYAYDATRVVLPSGEYINANYIDGYSVSPSYIACLGPVKSAMNQFTTFWDMIWQENTAKIVMLTNLEEDTKMNCEQYWPDDGSTKRYGETRVTTKSELKYVEYVIRELKIENGMESRLVMHYQYTAWPDKSVPDTLSSLLEFRDIVERNPAPIAGPMVVHCSAGIGRTGTYIALDILVKEDEAENSVDVFGCVLTLRGQRAYMVQNVVQYIYLHHCLVYALRCDPKPMQVVSLLVTLSDVKIQEQFQTLQSILERSSNDLEAVTAISYRKETLSGVDIPGDSHRVKLTLMKTDFINAVYIDGYSEPKKYIAAQTPLSADEEQFLSMLYQENITVIVDLEDDQPAGVGYYIPPAEKIGKCGQFQITCEHTNTEESFVERRLLLSKKGEPPKNRKKMTHYQIKGWKSDVSLPESQTNFLHLISSVSSARMEKGSVLVHCLDGASKCGLFCALSVMLEKLTIGDEVSLVNTVCQVRGRRRTALQDIDQFRFCYRCVQEYLETEAAKVYENIV